MPLSFNSLSHGRISFGFFNIKTDLVMLENYFFFAKDFCELIKTVSQQNILNECYSNLNCYEILFSRIGDLGSAISGLNYTGFIGEIYKLFPFPKELSQFRQDPEGEKTRQLVLTILEKYSKAKDIVFYLDAIRGLIKIGRFLFNKDQFYSLLNYIWLGGYPRWKENKRPGYLIEMYQAIMECKNPIFKGFNTHPLPWPEAFPPLPQWADGLKTG